VPKDPTIRSPLLRLPGMRRSDAPSLGRRNQHVRRNVPQLRRLLTPKIRRRRQPTEALMMTTTEECDPEECHPEEVQAFATRRPADEGSLHCAQPGLAQTVAFNLLTRVPRPSSAWAGAFLVRAHPRLPHRNVEKPGAPRLAFETWAGQIGKGLLPISPPNRQKPFANVRRFPPFLKTTNPAMVVRNSRHGKEKTSSAQMARNHTRGRDLHSLQS
jgi:hypothetical protein